MDILETLNRLPLFEGVSPAGLNQIKALVQLVTLQEEERLFKEGSAAEKMYVLLEGKVRVQVKSDYDPGSITISVLDRFGQVVGWSGLIGPNDYTAAAVGEANSKLLAIDGNGLRSLLDTDPAMAAIIYRHVAEVISNRLRNIQRVVLKTL